MPARIAILGIVATFTMVTMPTMKEVHRNSSKGQQPQEPIAGKDVRPMPENQEEGAYDHEPNQGQSDG
jgi:hypothetical protein